IKSAVNSELLHAARIGIEDFEFERAGSWHEFAAYGHATDPRRHVAGKSINLLRDVAHIEFATDGRSDVLETGASVREERAVGLVHTPGAVSWSCSSAISPTICSTMSSIDTTPSAPPYSSTTSARWMRVVCILASRSRTGIEGGAYRISRTILAAESGIDRSTVLRSRPAGSGFLRRRLLLPLTLARTVMKATRSRMWTMPPASSR